ncbi:DNA mismatch repair protein [Rhodocytophaga rosea]|uniref:DNA mismatch repair protein n=1 Tax=Rhodocytophaga rosea TaxID=2704465 RepID=A0A6C0GTX4_9BACT|nr:DNA mismatch repair protein [Rhodocytophaga rosea]QHT71367.1 DNA mismatch repair protein [Rhodocytophaga rosea]
MSFHIDTQTKKDLQLFDEGRKSHSVFSYFNHTRTKGGKALLYQMMLAPLNEEKVLTDRQNAIRFFGENQVEIGIDYHRIDMIEYYLNLNVTVLKNNPLDACIKHVSAQLRPDNNYYLIQTGIEHLIYLFRHLHQFIASTEKTGMPALILEQFSQIEAFLQEPMIQTLVQTKSKLSFLQISQYDHLLRKKFKPQLFSLLDHLYQFDVFETVARIARQKSLTFPEYVSAAQPQVTIQGLFHPLLENPVLNDIEISSTANLFFLTGPNMAGKSTFLKSLGLSIYLAHIGFPVPASYMQTSLYNGLITTINLADSMQLGYSHFYSEVKRVKETALMIKENKSVFVIFDELFRGTNVKDALDASLLVISAFAKIKTCSFFVSTHLTEVAKELPDPSTICFKYFESSLIGNKPVYSYKLQDGISEERLGILIVQNEKITEILDSIGQK